MRLPALSQAAPKRLVVVLPGRADDLASLRRSGVADAIRRAWPDADVVFAELRLGDYKHGDAPERLHRDVILPARHEGYREIWLAGASLGGMGTLMYDRLHPGQTTGLILLAPYLGEGAAPDSVAAAGGLSAQLLPDRRLPYRSLREKHIEVTMLLHARRVRLSTPWSGLSCYSLQSISSVICFLYWLTTEPPGFRFGSRPT